MPEVIKINNIEIPVMPTDVTFFSDNAIVQEVYIRAPCAFSFRSKHSRSVLNMMFSFPIMDLGVSEIYDSQQADLAQKGRDLILSLDAYPFCFIESPRVKAYLGSHNFSNESGDAAAGGVKADKDLMMFGVQRIRVTEDQRVPGIIVLSIDLLYCNHRILTPDMVVRWQGGTNKKPKDVILEENRKKILEGAVLHKSLYAGSEIASESPDSHAYGFDSILSNTDENRARAEVLLRKTSDTAAVDNYASKQSLSAVRIKVPQFINLATVGIKLSSEVDPSKKTYKAEDFIGNIENLPPVPEEDLKFISMPTKYLPPKFLVSPERTYFSPNFATEIEDFVEDESTVWEPHAVVWLEDLFAYDNNLNPIQTFTITKERAFASQFIGSIQHPILQYMGFYPAQLEIVSAFNGSDYDDSSSIVSLFKTMLGVIDNNAVNYPLGNAFNFVKVQTYSGLLLGVENFTPSQSQIIASAQSSDLELFSCSFVENNMQEMKRLTEVTVGRDPSYVSVEGKHAAKAIELLLEYAKRADYSKMERQTRSFLERIVSDIADVARQLNGEPYLEYIETE